MRESVRIGAGVAMMVVAFASVAGAAQAPPTGDPLAIEAAALVPLESESRLSIVGIHGQIAIEAGDRRELRVVSRVPGPTGAELPVGIWQDGSTMLVAPPPGDKGGARALRVELPRAFAIAVDAADSDVSIASAEGGIEFHGKNARVVIQASGGPINADLEGGSLSLGASSEATLRLRGTTLEVSEMSGNVNVRAVGGSLSLRGIRGSTDVESDECKLVLDDLSGAVHVKAGNGDATVKGLAAGAELAMSAAPLHLKDGRGDITVTSDAPVDFLAMAASLHFDMYGGSLRGKGNQGILEVRTRNTEVNLESIDGAVRIQGDGLKAKLVDIAGELYIETTISDVVVDRVGSVIVILDRGSASIQRAAGAVQATVNGGDVRILDASGPVTLDLDRGDAEVSWATLGGAKDSNLVNKGGNITVSFPASGVCRVEAKSQYGHIDSNLPTVKVMDDRTEAQGPVNYGNRPIVNIVANGDIHLQDASKIPPAE